MDTLLRLVLCYDCALEFLEWHVHSAIVYTLIRTQHMPNHTTYVVSLQHRYKIIHHHQPPYNVYRAGAIHFRLVASLVSPCRAIEITLN